MPLYPEQTQVLACSLAHLQSSHQFIPTIQGFFFCIIHNINIHNMSQRTVPHCHPNYDVPSLSTADLKLKLSSRLSYVHPSHLIVIAVMHAALKKSHVLMIRTHSEWCCHIWFTLKQKCKGLTERSLSLRCAVYVTVIFGYELLLFRFTFCIECLIFMFSNPQFHLPWYGIFYLSFFFYLRYAFNGIFGNGENKINMWS